MVYAASIPTYLKLSLAEVLIFSLTFSQALFMSWLSFKFSKVTDLFKILVWYCCLTCGSLCFLRLNLSTPNLCNACLLTANLSLTSATTRQWSVSVNSLERLYMEYTCNQSPIYQSVIHLPVSLPIRRGPGVFMYPTRMPSLILSSPHPD